MYSLEVIAVPVFAAADREWLEHIRKARAHSIGPPHFTLVFPGSRILPADYSREVTEAVAGVKRIAFCLRSAMVVPDAQVNCCHVFLVPDEGFGAIVRLHDRLHRGILAENLRTHFTYLPHLTVASVSDPAEARQIAAKLNAEDFAFAGHIDELEIHRRDGETVRCAEKIPLARQGWFK